jgi:hypothetical protein
MTVTAARLKPKSELPGSGSKLDFEDVYRANVGAVTAFFARCCRDRRRSRI